MKKEYQTPFVSAIIILPQGGMMTASDGDYKVDTSETESFEEGTELRARQRNDVWEDEDNED